MGKASRRKHQRKEDSVLIAYEECAPAVFSRNFAPNHCINGTRVTIDALAHFGIQATPAVVRAAACNREWVELLRRNPDPTRGEMDAVGAWSVLIDEGASTETEFAGHLICIVGHRMVDSASGQMRREQKGMLIPDVIVADVSDAFIRGDESVAFIMPHGGQVMYRVRRGVRAFDSATGFRRHEENLRVTQELIDTMKAHVAKQ